MEREIWLAGGCYWGAEKYLSCLRGVLKTEVGFANGHVAAPSYDQVKHTETGHAETVHVTYDDSVIPLKTLLSLFVKIIDPTSVNRQGEDVGTQYRTGIYTGSDEDLVVSRDFLRELGQGLDRPVAVECEPLRCFYTAEEYHQKYLDKNPGGYCHVPFELIAWARTWRPGE